MSHHHHHGNYFSRVVNSDVQTSAILEGVVGALSNINSSPGFTGFVPIKPTTNITLDSNTLNAIADSKTIIIDGTGSTSASQLIIGADTEDNAKSLIKTFGLDKNTNPKLIKLAKVGGAGSGNILSFGTTGGTTTKYISMTKGLTGLSVQSIGAAASTKSGYLAVELGSTANSIIFDVVAEQAV